MPHEKASKCRISPGPSDVNREIAARATRAERLSTSINHTTSSLLQRLQQGDEPQDQITKAGTDMNTVMTNEVLQRANSQFRGTGGRSLENAQRGFEPAFLDRETHSVYRSRFSDGRNAPIHLLDGLPPELVLARTASGRVASVKASIVAGFTLQGEFYTRESAARIAGNAPDRGGTMTSIPSRSRASVIADAP